MGDKTTLPKRLWKNPETKNLLFVGLEYSGLAGGVFQSTLRAAALFSAGFVAIQSGSAGYLPSPRLAIEQNDSQFFIPPFFNRLLSGRKIPRMKKQFFEKQMEKRLTKGFSWIHSPSARKSAGLKHRKSAIKVRIF